MRSYGREFLARYGTRWMVASGGADPRRHPRVCVGGGSILAVPPCARASLMPHVKALTRADLDFGVICPLCAAPKAKQSRTCQSCYEDRLRDELYWQRRTCVCGNAKWPRSGKCRACENARPGHGLRPGVPQPQSHPWRRRAA
jgi:hypothetical protein